MWNNVLYSDDFTTILEVTLKKLPNNKCYQYVYNFSIQFDTIYYMYTIYDL